MAFIKNLMKLKRSRRLKEPLETPDLIVVGLGNPGPQYENTRHNAGWWLKDLLVKRHDIEVRRAHSTARVRIGKVEGRTIALVKPRTHVNGSGEVARYLLARFRTTRDRLLIVYDETALPPRQSDAGPRRSGPPRRPTAATPSPATGFSTSAATGRAGSLGRSTPRPPRLR